MWPGHCPVPCFGCGDKSRPAVWTSRPGRRSRAVEKRGYPVTRQAVAYPFHAARNPALASSRLSVYRQRRLLISRPPLIRPPCVAVAIGDFLDEHEEIIETIP